MQIGSTPGRSTRWRSRAAKLVIGLVGTTVIALAALLLGFRPPTLPEPPLYRITPGIGGLGFSNSGCGQRDKKQGYSYRFTKRDARCIYAEIHLPPDMPKTTIHAVFYDVEGQVLHEENVTLEKISYPSIAWVSAGQDQPGQWPPGIYRVEFIVDGAIVAADEFQITDP